MPRGQREEIRFPSLDELFSSQEERDDAKLKRIYEIPLEQIDPYPEHPFYVKDDEDMMNLVESVRTNGIMTPAIVRPKEDGRYELVAGHRRKRACELAGIATLRAEIKEMSRDEAIIYMVESNFQRTTILPSEKAFAYKMRLEAMKRQGKRTDLTSTPVGQKLKGTVSVDRLGQEVGDSSSQIQRYIRLTELISPLLQLVDDGKIALRPAVELSYLPKEMQEELSEVIDMEQCTPTHAQAIRMRRMDGEGKLTPEVIEVIMQEEKPNQKERIVLRGERFASLFPKNLPLSKRFSFVPFKITSVTNGETHVVVTDKNGFFSTKDRRASGDLDEDEDEDTARNQNPFDDLLEAKEIKSADLAKRSKEILQGVWFGTGEFGSKAAMNIRFGALPYDSYILEEIPCETNEGYILQKFFFTVDQKSQNGFVDLETITDDVPEIGTEASVNGENANIRPNKEITLIDTIEYKNLKKGETYTAHGRLMDKAAGEVCRDAAGKEITAEQEFTARTSSGKVKVTFTFDGSLLYGKDTVVFEKVYDSEGHVAATHEDIEDEGQTVTWEKLNPAYEMYKIRTTKAPSKGDKYGFFARDEVEYEVHVENTGNVVLTMDVSDQFTQNLEYFTVPELKDVKFTAEGTWNNKGKDKNIANITLNPGEKATVTYTAVVSDEAKEYLAAKAKDSDSLDKKGHDTNRIYQANKTDDKDGYWNTAKCENVTYPNPEKPDEPGTLEPKDDTAQTPVQKPEIGTTLTDDKGKKEVVTSKETKLVDTVEYKGLDKTKWYVITGTLMVKDSGDPLVENGKEITVTSEPFKPWKANGKQEITFTVNTEALEGKELVAFETAYRLNGYKKGDDVSKTPKTTVAEHKDLEDEGQTVKMKN